MKQANKLIWMVLLVFGQMLAGSSSCLGQSAGSRLWEYPLAPRVTASPALGPDGTIYCGGGFNLHALTPEGSLKWQFTTKGMVQGSAAVGPDGSIYVGSFDTQLYSISPAGTQQWAFATLGRIYSSPAVDLNGAIYFGSDDKNIYALDSQGLLRWAFPTEGPVRSSPALDTEGNLYIGSWDKNLYALSAGGTQKWVFTTGHYIYSSPAIGLDGTIYFGSVDKRIYALNPDGSKKWDFPTEGHVYASPAIGPDESIYCGSWDNRLYALSPLGKLKWSFSTANLVQSTAAVGADGAIYFGSDENKVYALNSDGTLRWSYTTGSIIRSSPVLSTNGTMYIGSEDGKLYALRGGSGPAATSWPMYRADARRRGKVLLLITRQPPSQIAVVNNNVSFQILVAGPGPVFYQWKRNGHPVEGGTNATLLINNAQPEDGGEYSVVMSNVVEVIQSQPANLTIIVPPVIVEQPQSQKVAAGREVTFRTGANTSKPFTSLGPLTYQWFFNGTNLLGATASELTLSGVGTSHMGDYQVQIRNAAGSVTSQVANLTVVTPPILTSQPTNQTVAEGSPASFAVEVKSLDPPSIQWRHNGVVLPGAASPVFSLKSAQLTNAGAYTAEVRNMAGSLTSAPAQLVVVQSPSISTPPQDVKGVRGKSATFHVVSESTGSLSYQWRHDGVRIPGAASSQLIISNLLPAHAGAYLVVVSNIAGSVTSPPAYLEVHMPPIILSHPQSVTSLLSRVATFHVEATGSPPMHFEWHFQSAPIPNQTNPALVLNPVAPQHAGDYSVVVTNAVGSVTSRTATLVLPAKPSLWERFKSWIQ